MLLRNLDGDPSSGLGLRVIGAGSVPMTITIAPGLVGARTAVEAVSAEGSWSGVCIRHRGVVGRS